MSRTFGIVVGLVAGLVFVGNAYAHCGNCNVDKSKVEKVELSDDGKKAYEAMKAEVEAKSESIRKDMKEVKKKLKDVFIAEKFDADSYDRLKKQYIKLKVKKMHNKREAKAEMAKSLSQKDRHALVHMWEHKYGDRDKACDCKSCSPKKKGKRKRK